MLVECLVGSGVYAAGHNGSTIRVHRLLLQGEDFLYGGLKLMRMHGLLF